MSGAFRSLVPSRSFCVYVCSDLFSVQRLFTRETIKVRRGENEANCNLKLLQNFARVQKAEEG